MLSDAQKAVAIQTGNEAPVDNVEIAGTTGDDLLTGSPNADIISAGIGRDGG